MELKELDVLYDNTKYDITDEDIIKIYDLDNIPKEIIYNTLLVEKDKMLLFYIPYNSKLKNTIIDLNNKIKDIVGIENYDSVHNIKRFIVFYIIYTKYGEDISDIDYKNFIEKDKNNYTLEYPYEFRINTLYYNPDCLIDDSRVNYVIYKDK